MPLTSAQKSQLNAFATREPALQTPGAAPEKSSLKLGDVLDNLSAEVTVKAVYDSSKGLLIGAHGTGVKIPAGAIVTGLVTEAETALASGGSATVAISAGAATLLAATAFNNAALTGIDVQTVTATKVTVESEVTVTVAVADLTDGKLNLWVKYLK